MKDNKTTNLITGEDKENYFCYKKPPKEKHYKGVDYNKYLKKFTNITHQIILSLNVILI